MLISQKTLQNKGILNKLVPARCYSGGLRKDAKSPRLYRRGATYNHRAAIPKDIADSYPKSEETFSLRTRDPREALQRVRVAAVEVDQRFADHRRNLARQSGPALSELTQDQLDHIHQCYYWHLLDEDEETRLSGFEGRDFDEDLETHEALTGETRRNYARGELDAFYSGEAEEVLSWDNIDLRLSPNSPSWPKLVRTVHEASLKAAEAISKRYEGEIVPTPVASRQSPPAASGQRPAASASGPLLSEMFKQQKTRASRTGEWSPKLVDDYETWTQLFIECVGDRPLLSYVKADARQFKDLLMALPSNRHKKAATMGLSAADAVKVADANDLPRLSVSTINKALGRLQATWNWADKQLDEDIPDIFGPMKLPKKTTARDERDPFNAKQLNAIFSGPLYTGCRSERFRAQSGNVDMRHTHWFWLPLLGLYTGARLNELYQLRTVDVVTDDDVPHLRLHEVDDTQRIKGSSERIVPLHSDLLTFGFLDYLRGRQSEGAERLFDLMLDSKGYYSDRSSKDFSAYITAVGAKTKRTSFHSLRHSFKDAARDSGIQLDIADLLQGHSLKGMAGRYGTGRVALSRLREEIDKLAIDGLLIGQLSI